MHFIYLRLSERTKPGAGNEIQLTDGCASGPGQGLWAYIYEGISYDAGV